MSTPNTLPDASGNAFTSTTRGGARYAHRPRLCLVLPLAALLAGASGVGAQDREVPERRLTTKPAAAWAAPLSDISGVRELSDGRVIVLDSKEQRIALVDLDAGTSHPIGRKGKGPGEFGRAVRLLPMPGDSTFVVDGENRRILVIGGDGTPNGIVTSFGTAADAIGLGTWALRDVDVVRGAYFQGRGRPPKDGEFVEPDSLPILRLDLVTKQIDSIANFAIPHSKITIAREGQKITSVNIERPPFSVGDEWAVGDDGRVAVARRSPYRLDLISRDLRIVRGPDVQASERTLDEADKSEYLANREGGASIDPATLDWPERMPIFLPGAVITVPNGETWVRRTAEVNSPARRYDVFDATGKRVAQVVTSPAQRVVLVTARGVYLARSDEDGLQYLERYPLPR